MYCQKCGKQIDDGSAFCQYCGVHTGNFVSNNSVNEKVYQTTMFSILKERPNI